MSNSLLAKNRVAEATILPNRIVKPGATDDGVLMAAAATDFLIGVVEGVAPVLGERGAVELVGIAELKLGGTIVRGGPVTSDATGQGVAAIAGNRAVGYAMVSGVAGDVIEVLLCQHTV